ncbi:MAG: NADPH-dependent assimilatory sulfite reductase hemoprotein subunit [Rhodospirillales bacterium]|nr:NADPH-dependent assimilatory sulfite reductase hemoprotein subunit [Rhodospirillales bacterium]
MSDDAPLPRSPVERIKERSRFLRGSIADGLHDVSTGALAEDDTQLTKFHGIYQQDDRDLRPERARKKMEKAFSFMARLRIPGGVVTSAQWLALDRIADARANGTLRITTRQTIQFHGIIKSNLKRALQDINAALLDTIAACGDVNRNVIATANPDESAAHADVVAAARAISAHLAPRSRAYHEIWLDDELVAGGEPESEPLYGALYLPRKFKIAIAVPPRNDVDVFAHEVGLIATVENGRVVGYNVAVGGGMGMTHGEPHTYPRLGEVIGWCSTAQAIDVCEKILTVQRDFGNRADRRQARMKYLIAARGLDWFRAQVEERLGYPFAPARPYAFDGTGDRLGWREDAAGRAHFTLHVENGRVVDRKGVALRTGLAEIARVHHGNFVMTTNQNIIIAGIPADARAGVAALLDSHGLANPSGGLRRNAMACVALPTCGLALAESERYLPTLVTKLETLLQQAGLAQDEIVIRMTGCPNGCARPYLAEIGLVGRNPGLYNLHLGAAFDGTRLNRLYRKDLDEAGILAALAPMFSAYARQRQDGERFGDFAIRAGFVPGGPDAPRQFHEAAA